MPQADSREAWDAWPSQSPAQQAFSRAGLSGTDTPSAAWHPSFHAPSFGPLSHHKDTGGAAFVHLEHWECHEREGGWGMSFLYKSCAGHPGALSWGAFNAMPMMHSDVNAIK